MPEFSFGRYAAPTPTAYHRSLVALLKRREPDLWRWFASEAVSAAACEDLRLDLLRRTFPIERAEAAPLYDAADEIARALELGVPVSLRRAEDGGERNAALYFEPTVAHVVFEGDVLEALDAAEIRFVLGHELAHHAHYRAQDGAFWAAARLVKWVAEQPNRPRAFAETARLDALYTEVFADRVGLWATGDLETSLNAHVKLAHRVDDASGAAYLAQAEEMLADAATREAERAARGDGAAPQTHPDAFVRAALLAAWSHDPSAAETRARALIEGASSLEALDLLGRERVADISHWMLYEFLGEPWIRRDLVRAHAREIDDTLADVLEGPRHESEDIDRLRAAIAAADDSVKRYLAYLLLDFATVDPQLDDVMLAAALQFAADFGLSDDLRRIAAQELKITRTKLGELERSAASIVAKAELSLGAFGGGADGAETEREAAAPTRAARGDAA